MIKLSLLASMKLGSIQYFLGVGGSIKTLVQKGGLMEKGLKREFTVVSYF